MRKILMLTMAAVLSISSALATTVYCKMTQSWWTTDGAAVGVHYWGGASAATTWPGVRMTAVTGEEGLWTYDVPSDVTGLIFVRVNGSGTIADWGAQTKDLTLPTDGKNMFTITNTSATWGSNPGCDGTWSTYTPVVSKVTYTALTAAPSTGNWAGQYLIVFEDHKAHATVSGSDLAATSDALTITSGAIEINSTDAYYVTVELMQGGYSIKLPSGKYLSVNANSNAVAAVNNPFAFNFEYTSSGIKIFGTDTQGNIRYVLNNGSYYRGYKWNDSFKLPTLYRTGAEGPALQTVYFLNKLDWTTVNAFVWPASGNAYKEWPGEAMLKTADQVGGKDLYSYTFPATYVNVIFNNGTDQTADLTWTTAKPYFVPGAKNNEGKYTGAWYASKDEIPTPKYYIAGSMTNWAKDMVEMTPGNGDSLSVEINLLGDYYYEFKVVRVEGTDTTWYGNAAAATMEYGSCTGWWLTGDVNVGLQTTGTAKYKFIFKKNDNHEISVVIPKDGGTVVPATETALLNGVFSIAANATAKFSRGNLQYNYGANKWYFAEKQYDVVADANLRLGDENYKGSVDMLSWSCESSQYGLLPSNKDADFTGAFVDWGGLFTGDVKYSTLSTAEWKYLFQTRPNASKLWTMIALLPEAGSTDTLCGLVILPDNWEKPAGLTFTTGFYDLENTTALAANTFTFAQWQTFENAGAVFLPCAGSRAGCIGNTWNGDKETTVVNPETGWYDWFDNLGWLGYYWLSTPGAQTKNADYIILPGMYESPAGSDEWHYTTPAVWSREKRRGNSVRLVEKTYLPEYYIAGSMTDWATNMVKMTAGNADTLTTTIALEADSLYEFKVVKVVGPDTTWYGNEGEATMTYGHSTGWWLKGQVNVGLQTTQAGDYEFIFEKNENNMISVVMPAPLPIDTAWYVAGTFTNWASEMKSLAGEKKDSLLLTVALPDTVSQFKLVRVNTQGAKKDTTWFGLNETANMTYDNSKGWWLYESGEYNQANVGIEPTKAGDYTFIVNPLNKTDEDAIAPVVSVIMPEPDPIDTAWYVAGTFTNWASDMKSLAGERKDSLLLTVALPDTVSQFKLVRVNTQGAKKDTTWFGLNETANMTYDNSKGWWLYESGEYNQANVGIEPTKAGDYTFIVNPLNKTDEDAIAPVVSVIMPEPDPIDTAWYVAGTFTNWASEMKSLSGEKKDSLLLTVALPDTVSQFKLVRVNTQGAKKDTTWFGLNETANMTYDNSKGWWLYESGEYNQANVGIEPTKAGDYTFIVNPLNKADENILAPIVSVVMPAPELTYYLKNNWNAAEDWTWKAMTKDGENFKLENVVYGGTGVNYNTAQSDEGAEWVAEADFLGDKIGAKDTVSFTLNPVAGTITATLLGKYNGGPEPDKVYTIVGEAALVGVEWNPEATANDMVKQGDGSYKLVKENVVLEVKGYEYKVVADHSWEGWQIPALGQGNQTLTISAAGTYNVTFTLSADLTTLSATATSVGPAPEKVYTIVGEEALVGVDWNPEATTNDMVKQSDGSYKLVKTDVQLVAKAYEYKVVEGHVWTGWQIPAEGNQTLTINEAGKYTVTFTLNSALTALTANAVKEPSTAIENIIAPANELRKVMIDGKLYILRDGKVYSVQGQLIR